MLKKLFKKKFQCCVIVVCTACEFVKTPLLQLRNKMQLLLTGGQRDCPNIPPARCSLISTAPFLFLRRKIAASSNSHEESCLFCDHLMSECQQPWVSAIGQGKCNSSMLWTSVFPWSPVQVCVIWESHTVRCTKYNPSLPGISGKKTGRFCCFSWNPGLISKEVKVLQSRTCLASFSFLWARDQRNCSLLEGSWEYNVPSRPAQREASWSSCRL